jgi:hypothetical protein
VRSAVRRYPLPGDATPSTDVTLDLLHVGRSGAAGLEEAEERLLGADGYPLGDEGLAIRGQAVDAPAVTMLEVDQDVHPGDRVLGLGHWRKCRRARRAPTLLPGTAVDIADSRERGSLHERRAMSLLSRDTIEGCQSSRARLRVKVKPSARPLPGLGGSPRPIKAGHKRGHIYLSAVLLNVPFCSPTMPCKSLIL